MNRLLLIAGFAVLVLGCGYDTETNLLGLGPSAMDWWDSDWPARRQLTIDNGGQGTLADFPVMVLLDASRIDYEISQDTGGDLRFIDTDGGVLSHEIERWDEAGESIVWVRVPEIPAGANHTITMYYGNSAAADVQDPTDVWDSGYVLVWHLGEVPTGTPDDITDSAENIALPDTASGTSQSMDGSNQVAGQAGFGLSFDGAGEWLNPTSPDPGFFHDAFSDKTFSAWIRSDNTSQTQTIFEEGGGTNGLYLGVDANQVHLATRDGGAGSQANAYQSYTDTVSFHYVAAVFEGGQLRLYLDDNAPDLQAAGYATVGGHSGEPGIGRSPDADAAGTGTNDYFDGAMDEIRMSNIARSQDWIAAEYLSVSDQYISLGEEQIFP